MIQSPSLHAAATQHLPSFITAPGETDVLMVVTGVFLAVSVIGFGVLFLRLHALPEHIAHGSHKVQMELVSVLCLIALFTHMHIFWIAALILAFVEIPNFGHPLRRIAGAVEKIAGVAPGEGPAASPPSPIAHGEPSLGAAEAPLQPDGTVALPANPAAACAGQKELSHA